MKTWLVLSLVAVLGLGTVALAGPPSPSKAAGKGACVQAGIGTLMDLGALQAAAKQDVNYAAFDVTGTGAIAVELGDEFFAPLGAIVKLHVTHPEVFSWC